VHYTEAIAPTGPESQAAAQQWILDYNEDDCRATAAVREWLDGDANWLPGIADVTPWS
jgi:predicted RecB family nuclease